MTQGEPRATGRASAPHRGTGRDRGSYRLQEAVTPGVLSAGGERLAQASALGLPRLRRGGFWPTGSTSMVTRRAGEGGDRDPSRTASARRIMAAAVAAAAANRRFENGGGSGGGQSARRAGRVARRRGRGRGERGAWLCGKRAVALPQRAQRPLVSRGLGGPRQGGGN